MDESISYARLDWFTSEKELPFFIQYGGHDTDLFMHCHTDFYELVIVMDGSAVHVVGNEEYRVKRGDVFAVGSSIPHGYKDTKKFRICNIMYRLEDIFQSFPDIYSGAGFQALFVLEPRMSKDRVFRSRLRLQSENYRAVKSMLDRLLKEYESTSDCRKTMVISLFAQLSVLLSRLYSFDENNSSQDIINIAKAASYIENHFTESFSVAFLAELSHYSERHFIRIFKRAYGLSPHEYIISLRLGRACRLLRDSDMNVSETAKNCGFEDINYFSRIFRRKTGLSPSEYKKTEWRISGNEI